MIMEKRIMQNVSNELKMQDSKFNSIMYGINSISTNVSGINSRIESIGENLRALKSNWENRLTILSSFAMVALAIVVPLGIIAYHYIKINY